MSFLQKLSDLFKGQGSKKGKGTDNPLEVISNLGDAVKEGNKKLDELQNMIPGDTDDKIIDGLQEKLGQDPGKS